MSKYTTELRFVCENMSPEIPPYNTRAIIQNAIPNIFDFEYELFDENYKNVLETKIIRHYYFNELGQETYGRWKFALENKINEIMPYYNLLYKTATYEFDPTIDFTTTKTSKLIRDEDTSGTDTSSGNHDTTDTQTREITAGYTGKETHSGTDTVTDTIDETDIQHTNQTTDNDLSEAYATAIDDTTTTKSGAEHTRTIRTGGTETTNTATGAESDTPQGSINAVDFTNNETSLYLTRANHNTNSNITDRDETDESVILYGDDEHPRIDKVTVTKQNVTKNTGTVTVDNNYKVDRDGTNKSETEHGHIVDSSNEHTSLEQSNHSQSGTFFNTDGHTSKLDRTDDYAENVSGLTGRRTTVEMIKEYRENLINIDMMIIKELAPLFMQVY